MRGRTNVGGGSGGVFIKADTKNFIVSEGESVTAGDFVEYKTQQNEGLIANAYITFYDQTKIGENLLLTLSEGALLLLKMDKGQLKIINSYNESVVYDYLVLSDGSIVIRVKDYPYITRLKVESDLFNVICQAENVTDNPVYGNNRLAEYNGKLYLIGEKKYTTTNSEKYGLVFYVFDISNAEKITYIDKKETDSDFIGTMDMYEIYSTFVVKDYIYLVERLRKYSYNDTEYRIIRITFDDVNDLSGYEIVSQKIGEAQKPIVFYEKYIFWIYNFSIYLFNNNSKATNVIGLDTLGFYKGTISSDWLLPRCVFSEVGSGKLSLFNCADPKGTFYTYETAIIQIDELTGNINKISNIFEPNIKYKAWNTEVVYLEGTINNIYKINGTTRSYYVSYDQETNVLSDQVDTAFVKPYVGGSAIGVAKQSGISGQMIEVYVPKV